MIDELAAALRPLANRVGNLLARGRLSAIKTSTKMQTLQLDLLAGESKDRLEHFEPYGFTSYPHPGAEAIAAFLDGDRSHGVVLVAADRRYRLTTLAEGEMCIHDDLNQKVHLTRAGIIVEGGGLPMIFRNTPSMLFQADTSVRFETATFEIVASAKVRATTPLFEVTGLLQPQQLTIGLTGAGVATMTGGSINYSGVTTTFTGGSITHDGKAIDKTHIHGGVQTGGSNTATPN